MQFNLPVSWSADSWPTDLTLPALTLEEFITGLRQKGARWDGIDPQLLQLAAFSYYCGSVAGGGHVDFICNNETDFLERILLAQQGARLLRLTEIADILAEFEGLLPSGNIADVYTAWLDQGPNSPWREENGEMVVLSALDKRLFAVQFGPEQRQALSNTLSGAAKVGFDHAIAADTYSASNPQYVSLYAWMATYDGLDYGTYQDAMAKTAHIVEQLSSR